MRNMNERNAVKVANPHLENIQNDFLYHFGLHSKNSQLEEKFSDVKFVFMGGSEGRMREFAEMVYQTLKTRIDLSPNCARDNIAESAGRYVMFKVGPVLALNHGMGMPSLSIALHEIVKLLHYAGAFDVEFVRLGTSGGVDVEPGTICITRTGYTERLEPFYPFTSLGKTTLFNSDSNVTLCDRYVSIAESMGLTYRVGNTVGTDDFYEAQGRLDGTFCTIEEADKLAWLSQISNDHSIINFEMEAPLFLAFCRRANIPGAVICVALLNRLEGDQVTTPKDKMKEFVNNVLLLAINYIKNSLDTRDSEEDSSESSP